MPIHGLRLEWLGLAVELGDMRRGPVLDSAQLLSVVVAKGVWVALIAAPGGAAWSAAITFSATLSFMLLPHGISCGVGSGGG